mmetsp:Transcript_21318/g.67374  ORF Transcript_21318/g.67374 Transcript_21318/m.67374 type:complete len:294 (-) Transcript_21318:50-931(-)
MGLLDLRLLHWRLLQPRLLLGPLIEVWSGPPQQLLHLRFNLWLLVRPLLILLLRLGLLLSPRPLLEPHLGFLLLLLLPQQLLLRLLLRVRVFPGWLFSLRHLRGLRLDLQPLLGPHLGPQRHLEQLSGPRLSPLQPSGLPLGRRRPLRLLDEVALAHSRARVAGPRPQAARRRLRIGHSRSPGSLCLPAALLVDLCGLLQVRPNLRQHVLDAVLGDVPGEAANDLHLPQPPDRPCGQARAPQERHALVEALHVAAHGARHQEQRLAVQARCQARHVMALHAGAMLVWPAAGPA